MKQIIKLAHLVWRNTEEGHVSVGHADPLDQPVECPLGVLPDLIRRPPEDDGGVAAQVLQEVGWPSDHPKHAGVSYDPQCGPVPDIRAVPQRGGVIHANDALCLIDLISSLTAQDVAGARYQSTVVTAKAVSLEKHIEYLGAS